MLLFLIFSFLVYKMNCNYKERYYKPNVIEISIAYCFYIISSLFAMSSNNAISLYFSLELHSLSLISLMFVITFVMVNVDFINFTVALSIHDMLYASRSARDASLPLRTNWWERCEATRALGNLRESYSFISLYQVEAALKYFLLSIIFSYALLIGIAICYAKNGQTDISQSFFSQLVYKPINFLSPLY